MVERAVLGGTIEPVGCLKGDEVVERDSSQVKALDRAIPAVHFSWIERLLQAEEHRPLGFHGNYVTEDSRQNARATTSPGTQFQDGCLSIKLGGQESLDLGIMPRAALFIPVPFVSEESQSYSPSFGQLFYQHLTGLTETQALGVSFCLSGDNVVH